MAAHPGSHKGSHKPQSESDRKTSSEERAELRKILKSQGGGAVSKKEFDAAKTTMQRRLEKKRSK